MILQVDQLNASGLMWFLSRQWFNSRCLAVYAGIGTLLLGAGCAPNDPGSPHATGRISHIKDFRLGLPEAAFQKAGDIFVKSTLPDKTRNDVVYSSRKKDKHGGTYLARFLDGDCSSVLVDFQDSPVSKELAIDLMNKLLPADRGALTEHDRSELTLVGLDEPVEYLYFGSRYGAEICYTVSGKERKVLFIHAWPNLDVLEEKLASNTG